MNAPSAAPLPNGGNRDRARWGRPFRPACGATMIRGEEGAHMMGSVALFVLAGLGEIGGGYLVWLSHTAEASMPRTVACLS